MEAQTLNSRRETQKGTRKALRPGPAGLAMCADGWPRGNIRSGILGVSDFGFEVESLKAIVPLK